MFVKRDLEHLGVEAPDRWHDIALDREEWKSLVEAAKDHIGPEPMEYDRAKLQYFSNTV